MIGRRLGSGGIASAILNGGTKYEWSDSALTTLFPSTEILVPNVLREWVDSRAGLDAVKK
jgi:hypothetical protein